MKLFKEYDQNGKILKKECSKCHKIKLANDFFKDLQKKDGVGSVCKECKKLYYESNKEGILERQKIQYEENKEKVLEKRKIYCESNMEKISVCKKIWYEKNKEGILERQKIQYEENKEYMLEKQKLWYEENKENVSEKQKIWYEENKEGILEKQRTQYKEKIKQELKEIRLYVERNAEEFNYNPNKEIYGVIYLVHNTESDKYYVGQTTIGFDNRYLNGWINDKGHKINNKIQEDLEKYGEDSFEYIKIFKVAYDLYELDKLEAYYIDYFDSYENGYNRTRGNIFTKRK